MVSHKGQHLGECLIDVLTRSYNTGERVFLSDSNAS
jgi:hypothetical protein